MKLGAGCEEEKKKCQDRASGRLQKKSQMLRDFQGQIHGKNGQFCGNFVGIFKASFTER